tara:strand:+ start:1726 stop:2169 length:444 start_codon:yes stop_codon:yes gene_type:complete
MSLDIGNIEEVLNKFTWSDYKNLTDSIMDFNEHDIESEMMKQGTVFAYYNGLSAKAKREFNFIHSEVTRLISDLRSSHKQESKVKLTAKDLDDLVNIDEDYQKLLSEMNEASFKYEILKGLCKALEQKKDMLVQLSSNQRAETKLYN